jgi:hypothetical protein
LAVEQLKEVLIALADEMNPGVLAELGRELAEVSRLHRRLVRAWDTRGTYLGLPFGDRTVPGGSHWNNLRSLADRALPGTSSVAGWYRVGVALGEYQLQLHQGGGTPFLPGLRAVVQAVQNLPADDRQAIPELQNMVSMAAELERTQPVTFLKDVLRDWQDFKPLSEGPILYDQNRALFALDSCLQERLRAFDRSAPPKPHWDGASRQLWYGDVVCKQYKRGAPCQEAILQAFEDQGWPHRILNPFPHKSKLAETISDLQESVRGSPIMFERDGTGKGITWRWRPQS